MIFRLQGGSEMPTYDSKTSIGTTQHVLLYVCEEIAVLYRPLLRHKYEVCSLAATSRGSSKPLGDFAYCQSGVGTASTQRRNQSF
jgi:hypothetical protein